MYQKHQNSERLPRFARFILIAWGCLGVSMPVHAEEGNTLHWIGAGGGAMPSMNQVSLEEDLRLLSRIMPQQGRVLYGGGGDHQGVMVARRTGRMRGLLQILGEIFSPQAGRNAFYRQTLLQVHSAFTRTNITQALSEALEAGTLPLLFFVAAHGEKGPRPVENYLSLWSHDSLSVGDLSALLDSASGSRMVRAVITACFSGGFADMVFHAGEESLGVGRANRCGFFSAPWDSVSSGCDPDPVRQHHEGYAIHFLNSFAGRDRRGEVLPLELSAIDGEAGLSMLEAHSYVRVVSSAVDVPTTTSERWLRYMAPDSGRTSRVFLPEEEYVIRELAKRLGVEGQLHRAREQFVILEYARSKAEGHLSAIQDEEYRAYRLLAAELLNRWPVLNDPWHPDYASLIRSSGQEISHFLAASTLYAEYVHALSAHDAAASNLDELMRRQAPYARLVRAMDTLSWAGQLKALGGPGWIRYLELLACERWVPPVQMDPHSTP